MKRSLPITEKVPGPTTPTSELRVANRRKPRRW